MKREEVQILGCKISKVISVDYFNKVDHKNYSVEDDAMPHPDLREALMDLQDDLAGAYSVIGDAKENFIPKGFSVTENDGQFFLTITGKFETRHEDTINISSGKIPMEDDPEDELVVKLNLLRDELYQYQWGDKSAEQKLPFEEKDQDDPDLKK